MKTYILILASIFSSFTFSSCNNDDDKNPIVEEPNHPIIGKWSLVKVEGGFSPTTSFEVGQIIWEFKVDNAMNVLISEGVVPAENDRFTSQYLGLNYTYSFNEEQTEITFVSNNYPNNPQKMEFTIDSGKLYLNDNVSSDGIGREFVKVQ